MFACRKRNIDTRPHRSWLRHHTYVYICVVSTHTRMYSYVLVYYLHVLLCTRLLLVCFSYVLVCTRMYSFTRYGTHMLLVCKLNQGFVELLCWCCLTLQAAFTLSGDLSPAVMFKTSLYWPSWENEELLPDPADIMFRWTLASLIPLHIVN